MLSSIQTLSKHVLTTDRMIIYPNNLNTQDGPFTYNLLITKYQAQFIKQFGPNWQMLMAGLPTLVNLEKQIRYILERKNYNYATAHTI